MKRVVKYFIPLVFLGLIVSCTTGKNESQTDTATNKRTFLTDFSIIAYSGPPLAEVTLERYQEIAEAGIEYLVPGNGTFDGEQNLKAMDLGLKTGLKIIPVDMRLVPFTLGDNPSIDTMVIREMVNDYQNHPSMAAYVVRDEPSGNLFPGLRDISNVIRAEDPLHEPLINLLPSYGSPTQLGFDDYRTHITTFIETVKPGLLSYDYYALREGATLYDGWFNDLAIVREETRKVNIPFIVFIQSQGIRGHMRVPNRAEILWQVNTALAYGTRGVGWFSYWTPLPNQGFQQEEGSPPQLVEAHYGAMIDINGNRTELYDHVREANLYLKKAGKGLLDWDNTEVARYEAGKMISGGSSPVITPEGEDANLVIGTFKKEGRLRIVISNSSCEQSTDFSLQISSDWKLDKVFTSVDANPAGEKASLLEWSIEPGGSVLIDLKPA